MTTALAEVLTARSRGAIAIIRVSGTAALAVVAECFKPASARPLGNGREDAPRFGRFAGDEVVVLNLGGTPASVEIHAHGGPMVVEAILAELERRGVERSEACPAASEAGTALMAAETVRVAAILLDQEQGALERSLAELATTGDPGLGQRLLSRYEIGRRLLTGWRIALAGRPNVGKSLLGNALVGFDRTIVSPVAGTTRDVIETRTAIDGWPVTLVDTAGLRSTDDALEERGILRARAAHEVADLVLVVLDRSRPLGDEDRLVLASHADALIAANKSDLEAAWDVNQLGAVAVSARTGDGLDRLLAEVGRRLVTHPPRNGEAVPFLPEHRERIERAMAPS